VKFSIITVTYNNLSGLSKTSESIAEQSFKDFEWIVVDGGSTDGTVECLSGFERLKIKWLSEKDNGIFDAMNKGLRIARGEYVLYLNADDFLVEPDTLVTVLAGISPGKHENPDLILGDVVMGLCGSRGWWRHRRVPGLLRRLRGTGLIPLHQAQFTRRTLLQAAGGFDPNKKYSADATQFYDLERTHRFTVRVVPRDVACMRPGGSANAGLKAIRLGTAEMYDHLKRTHGQTRAAGMVLVKTMQSLMEVRYGRCPHERWFASRTVER